MDPTVKNWIATSNYDLRTAEAMLKAGRYLYVVFMCHLSLEKMFKAVLAASFPDSIPPKIHSLASLYKRAGLVMPEQFMDFVEQLDNVSIVTRYPEDLRSLSREFNQAKAGEVLRETRKLLKWLKQSISEKS
ncbi:HEPN domain-containing protein [Geobacter benzoatilyticus]|uniref:HEPN domain-containing protein n=1 Tax=Geobacter benzoatilyticus TaxID=2815309 RepID=A0ABX7Q5X3_9BACT|nr:HEPN domain-containing protein [Geobacter benzoatilyticus]QSV46505.1 HEPN domain-containing protein [Geobacter benzoatilyticus]